MPVDSAPTWKARVENATSATVVAAIRMVVPITCASGGSLAMRTGIRNGVKGGIHDRVERIGESGERIAWLMKMIGIDLGVSIPKMERFDEQISKLRPIKVELNNLNTPIDIQRPRMDAQPVKIQIAWWCSSCSLQIC